MLILEHIHPLFRYYVSNLLVSRSVPRINEVLKKTKDRSSEFLLEPLNVIQFTIILRLNEVWKIAKWIPHEFSDKSKARGMPIFGELLQRNDRIFSLHNLVILLFKKSKERKFVLRRIKHRP